MFKLKIFCCIFVLLMSSLIFAQSVSDYKVYTAVCHSQKNNQINIVLRKFLYKNQLHYLTVNPDTLLTSIFAASGLPVVEDSWEKIREKYKDTAYFKAIEDAELNSQTYRDAGITHFFISQMGVDLTVDLCPSKRPLDRVLFTELYNEFGKEEKPVPVAVAITGIWMEEHEQDLQWLKELEKKNEIAITWINHSFNHRTSKDLPLRENFLLEKGTDIQLEILQTEARMIEKGIVPSVFFRFPGLVSDNKLFFTITAYGLIPVGSDAWLGKNQWPKEGSIVLVHANGNEPIGIQRFLRLIREERANIINKHWLLFDLRESIMEQEKNKKN